MIRQIVVAVIATLVAMWILKQIRGSRERASL